MCPFLKEAVILLVRCRRPKDSCGNATASFRRNAWIEADISCRRALHEEKAT